MEVDLTQLRAWARAVELAPVELDRQMLQSTRVGLLVGVGYAQEAAPIKDGPLRASITIKKPPAKDGAGYRGSYGSSLEYAAQREYGGTIYPRNGKFLVFEIEGQLIFAKSVTQTGSFYMEKSATRLEATITRIYQAGVDRALRSVGS